MRPPFKKLLQTSALMTGAMALVLSSAGVAGATEGDTTEKVSPGNSAAELELSPNGCTLDVSSDKDISNVKLYDGDTLIREIEEPSMTSFDVTGATDVSAKSGTTEKWADIVCTPAAPTEEPIEEEPLAEEPIEEAPVEDSGELDAGDDAVVAATLDCGDLTVTSTKDLSNIVVVFADDTEQKFDGLTGGSKTYTADELDGVDVTGVYIKSGNNSDDADELNSTGELVTPTVADSDDCDLEDDGTAPIDEIEEEEEELDNGNEAGNDMVTLCHATGSDTNPFVEITVSENAVDFEGHGSHEGDIIPLAEGETCEFEDEDDNNTPVITNPDENVSPQAGTPNPVIDVDNEFVLNPVTPMVPAVPAVPAQPTVAPATPAIPAQPAAVLAATAGPAPQVLGSQVTRSPGALAATGDATTNLVPFGLGLVLLGFGIQRKSKRLGAARVR